MSESDELDSVRRRRTTVRVEKRLMICLAVLSAVGIAACSSSHTDNAAATPTTSTTTTVANIPGVVGVDGVGSKTVLLPPSLSLPEIVHAHYDGPGKFVVSSVAADGSRVLVSANDAYEGTFPVGFVEGKNAPTAALLVQAQGPWHFDFASAQMAPRLPASGVGGLGDAVLSYKGPKARFSVTHALNTPIVLSVFANTLQTCGRARLVNSTITLPAGPLFVVVTAGGRWSIAPDNSATAPASSATSTSLPNAC
jgi:hypothetical protein